MDLFDGQRFIVADILDRACQYFFGKRRSLMLDTTFRLLYSKPGPALHEGNPTHQAKLETKSANATLYMLTIGPEVRAIPFKNEWGWVGKNSNVVSAIKELSNFQI